MGLSNFHIRDLEQIFYPTSPRTSKKIVTMSKPDKSKCSKSSIFFLSSIPELNSGLQRPLCLVLCESANFIHQRSVTPLFHLDSKYSKRNIISVHYIARLAPGRFLTLILCMLRRRVPSALL